MNFNSLLGTITVARDHNEGAETKEVKIHVNLSAFKSFQCFLKYKLRPQRN